MQDNIFNMENTEIHWCPGCGNFGVLKILKETLSELEIDPNKLVFVSGIGQAAKTAHYIKTNIFNGLHGRYLSVALAIKATNPQLTVIAESGDGCTYSEGGNHFIHTIRYNPDIVNIVHNNMVYGLTKGQASPTSEMGFKTKVQIDGVKNAPFNPLAVAISLKASFVARAFVGHAEKTKEIIKEAIKHKGYALVDLFSPCVSFNKVNTYKWFKENCYYLEESHDPYNHNEAFKRAMEEDKVPLGIFYRNKNKKTYEESLGIYEKDEKPLYMRKVDMRKVKFLIKQKK